VVHVFLLLVYVGTGESRYLASGDMYFRDITRCNFFAGELSRRYGNYDHVDWIDSRDRVTAYCVPKYLKKGSVEVY
jgi:hypothetical protein